MPAKRKLPTVAEIRALRDDLKAQNEAARQVLKPLLLAGKDTSEIRAQIDARDVQIDEFAALLEEQLAQIEADAELLRRSQALNLTRGAHARIKAQLAALQPPPAPGRHIGV